MACCWWCGLDETKSWMGDANGSLADHVQQCRKDRVALITDQGLPPALGVHVSVRAMESYRNRTVTGPGWEQIKGGLLALKDKLDVPVRSTLVLEMPSGTVLHDLWTALDECVARFDGTVLSCEV